MNYIRNTCSIDSTRRFVEDKIQLDTLVFCTTSSPDGEEVYEKFEERIVSVMFFLGMLHNNNRRKTNSTNARNPIHLGNRAFNIVILIYSQVSA